MKIEHRVQIRNAICGALFLAVVLVGTSESIAPARQWLICLILILVFVIVIPLRQSWRHVWRKLMGEPGK